MIIFYKTFQICKIRDCLGKQQSSATTSCEELVAAAVEHGQQRYGQCKYIFFSLENVFLSKNRHFIWSAISNSFQKVFVQRSIQFDDLTPGTWNDAGPEVSEWENENFIPEQMAEDWE